MESKNWIANTALARWAKFGRKSCNNVLKREMVFGQLLPKHNLTKYHIIYKSEQWGPWSGHIVDEFLLWGAMSVGGCRSPEMFCAATCLVAAVGFSSFAGF